MNTTTVTDVHNQLPAHHQWMRENYLHISLVATAAYLALVAFGPYFMRNRQAFDLRRPLFWWNLWLCMFSTLGVISVAPEFFDTLWSKGFRSSYCLLGDQYSGYNGEWVWLFHLSKLAEFGDTAFLVLRKKPVKFLHWYHHATVLVYAAYSYQHQTGACRWGVWMNYAVHSVMYCYFAFQSRGHKWSSWVAPMVTAIQIMQFIIGLYISVHMTIIGLSGDTVIPADPMPTEPIGCHAPLNVSIFQDVIYCTYLILFVQFFFNAHLSKRSSSGIKAGKME